MKKDLSLNECVYHVFKLAKETVYMNAGSNRKYNLRMKKLNNCILRIRNNLNINESKDEQK